MRGLNLFQYPMLLGTFALDVSAAPVISEAVPAHLALFDPTNTIQDVSTSASPTPTIVISSDVVTDAFKQGLSNVTGISVKPQLPHHFRYTIPRTDLVLAFLTLGSGSTPPSPDLKDVITVAQREAVKQEAFHGEEPVGTVLTYDYHTARFKLLPRPGLLWTTWGDAVQGLQGIFATYTTVELRFNLEKSGQHMGVGFLNLQEGFGTLEMVQNSSVANVTPGTVQTMK